MCVNAAVLVGDYLLTFHGSLLPPFSWSLQAKIPPEVECGKLSETFLAVYQWTWCHILEEFIFRKQTQLRILFVWDVMLSLG